MIASLWHKRMVLFACCLGLVFTGWWYGRFPTPTPLSAQWDGPNADLMARIQADHQPAHPLTPLSAIPCTSGMAGSYPCQNVDLLAFLPLNQIGGGEGNDIWGWTDWVTGHEYAIMGRTNGTAFVDITDPINPVYLGNLPTHTYSSIWRDIKVYANHAFIVADSAGSHGMQVFDLTQLRHIANPPVTFSESAHYTGFGSAHNIAINEASGYAYAVGMNSGGTTCSGGLHMINIQNPLNPTFAGCFSTDGYTHDTQCVNYQGPDPQHQGQELCFNANEDTLTIVNVTLKSLPQQVSRTPYAGSAYTHQGWLTPDHLYFLIDDELDEMSYGHNTRTYVWDVSNLDAPQLIGAYTAVVPAIDHNIYIHQGYAWAANYRSGLRILDVGDVGNANLSEVGYFDVYAANDNPNFNGAWSVYPYFRNGVVVVSGIEQGLFVLEAAVQPVYHAALSANSSVTAVPHSLAHHEFTLSNPGATDTFTLTLSGPQWPTTLLTPSPVTLARGTQTVISVEVLTPALPPATDQFTLTVTSSAWPERQYQALGQTETAVSAAMVNSGNQSAAGEPGEVLTYTVSVTNTGTYTDAFTISLAGNSWPVSNDTAVTPPLAVQTSHTLHPAITVGMGFSDTITLTLTSTLDPQVTTSITLTSNSLRPYRVYLPVLIRP